MAEGAVSSGAQAGCSNAPISSASLPIDKQHQQQQGQEVSPASASDAAYSTRSSPSLPTVAVPHGSVPPPGAGILEPPGIGAGIGVDSIPDASFEAAQPPRKKPRLSHPKAVLRPRQGTGVVPGGTVPGDVDEDGKVTCVHAPVRGVCRAARAILDLSWTESRTSYLYTTAKTNFESGKKPDYVKMMKHLGWHQHPDPARAMSRLRNKYCTMRRMLESGVSLQNRIARPVKYPYPLARKVQQVLVAFPNRMATVREVWEAIEADPEYSPHLDRRPQTTDGAHLTRWQKQVGRILTSRTHHGFVNTGVRKDGLFLYQYDSKQDSRNKTADKAKRRSPALASEGGNSGRRGAGGADGSCAVSGEDAPAQPASPAAATAAAAAADAPPATTAPVAAGAPLTGTGTQDTGTVTGDGCTSAAQAPGGEGHKPPLEAVAAGSAAEAGLARHAAAAEGATSGDGSDNGGGRCKAGAACAPLHSRLPSCRKHADTAGCSSDEHGGSCLDPSRRDLSRRGKDPRQDLRPHRQRKGRHREFEGVTTSGALAAAAAAALAALSDGGEVLEQQLAAAALDGAVLGLGGLGEVFV
ncbi:hypothetical protein Agub_g6469 [Astrephomene gubernaculifera]|uniref:Uncharacterized protein n=1 Tax=Astrephomene gubernaculifera TaxID=47775 RepID=A0AAD3HLG3_9CHLO|nr:hypothetical protein Agub_g6469 [Astrephomene gubernaculifera]